MSCLELALVKRYISGNESARAYFYVRFRVSLALLSLSETRDLGTTRG